MPRFALLFIFAMSNTMTASAEHFQLALRTQVETAEGTGRYHQLAETASWDPRETAVIVCDVWDLHHSQNAVRRATEFCPRLDQLLAEARKRGATIIHSPSDCMDAYSKHPARLRATNVPDAANLPDDIRSWCSRLPDEERAVYPIDQSDGGDDDDPAEHAVWVEKLKRLGRNTGTPWKAQTDLLTIDADRDFISDRGDEVWNVLESRKIKNVILTGVHTNMCVLGRPFGLRQMARNGKNVVLVRDLTDTMYNPARWPYVSHFAGTDLIVSHIERFVCPTITSDQILGGKPFRFSKDQRPSLAVVIAEDEYGTNETLPRILKPLISDFRITWIYGSKTERNNIPGLHALSSADLALISVRRRTLPESQLQQIREFVAAGKPVIGIRTASHAFSLRNKPAPEGLADWPEFDAEVFGGNYTNHHGNQLTSKVAVVDTDHPITASLPPTTNGVVQHGSLYMTSPLAKRTHVLLEGEIPDKPKEPVAWTFSRKDGGKSFYTSIGHEKDLANAFYRRMLINSIYWGAGLTPSKETLASTEPLRSQWTLTAIPQNRSVDVTLRPKESVWMRCAVRLTEGWTAREGISIHVPGAAGQNAAVWVNGHAAEQEEQQVFVSPRSTLDLDDANLIVVRLSDAKALAEAPTVHSGNHQLKLDGRWQIRVGADPTFSNIPLPARYGASTDILFEPQSR